jgi:hypothetical protein
MARSSRARAADLRGINRLTIAGIAGIVDLVEAMHQQIASVPGSGAWRSRGRTSGITRFVYSSIHGVIGFVGHGLDLLLAGFEPLLGERSTWRGRETLLAALNGVLGDYLRRRTIRWRFPCVCVGRVLRCRLNASSLPPQSRGREASCWCCCTVCA